MEKAEKMIQDDSSSNQKPEQQKEFQQVNQSAIDELPQEIKQNQTKSILCLLISVSMFYVL